MANHKSKFPTSHVVGFILSLVLTFGALLIALETDLSFNVIMWIVGGLAFLQAGVQLFMFMHLTEGENKTANLVNIAYSAFLAIVIVAGSIWVMSSGHMDHDNHEDHSNHTEHVEDHSNH